MTLHNSYQTSNSPSTRHILPDMDRPGFAYGDVWRQAALSHSDRDCLDDLVGQALIDHDVHDRLLFQHDPSLFDAFNLSDETRRFCATVQANTLKEFAEAIISAAMPRYNGTASAAV